MRHLDEHGGVDEDRRVERRLADDATLTGLAFDSPFIDELTGKFDAPRIEERIGKVRTMRYFIAGFLALGLAGCNQTVNQSGSGPISADALSQALPPIYEPLVDMNRVKESKYRLDLGYCRNIAAPQERVARAAAQQAEVGAVISLAGSLIGAVPASSIRQGRALGSTSGTLQGLGNSTAANGAAGADVALNDYALVVNTCLRHRGYTILR